MQHLDISSMSKRHTTTKKWKLTGGIRRNPTGVRTGSTVGTGPSSVAEARTPRCVVEAAGLFAGATLELDGMPRIEDEVSCMLKR